VLEVLVYLQSLSPMVIHRDIKPANLIKRADGSIALVDFGAAHVHGTTAGVTTIGTFGYMPIEQLAGIVDGTTDGFALGMTLLHLLTRQEPWKLAQQRTTVNVSAPLRAWLDKLTAPEPTQRFASAKDALAGLDAPAARVRRAKPRRPALLAAAAVVSFAAVGGGVFALTQHGHREHPTATPASPVETPEPPQLHVDKKVTWQLDHVKLRDFVLLAANTCGFSAVMPETLNAAVTVNVKDAPCDTAFATVLEAQSLTYAYDPAANLVRVVTRHDLAEERATADSRAHDALPDGNKVSLDVKDAPLHDVLRMLIDGSGTRCNLVIPDGIAANVTVRLADVPWNHALEAVLAANGLWYRYGANGKLIRIATRHDLAEEDGAR
jgi:serine/threonine protein kinase